MSPMTKTHPYPALARKIIEAHLNGRPMPGPEELKALSPDAGDAAL